MTKFTENYARTKGTPEPWQAWGTTARYLIIRLGSALPGIVVLVWLAAFCR